VHSPVEMRFLASEALALCVLLCADERRSNRCFGPPRFRYAEHFLERLLQGEIEVGHGQGLAEIDQAGHAVARIGDAARHDAGEMGEVRIDVERDAVETHPALETDADGGDLVLAAGALVGPPYPDADPLLAPLAGCTPCRRRTPLK